MYLQKVLSKNTLKKLIFCWHLVSHLLKKAGSGSGSQWYGSVDQDPEVNGTDPWIRIRRYRNVTGSTTLH
jgi:hypothetical protein